MRLPIRTGQFNTPIGAWTPFGEKLWETPRPNPRQRWGKAYGARLFVGLHVGGEPRWEKEDVIDIVKQHWVGGVSILSQMGIWVPAEGRAEEEPSVQIVLLSKGEDYDDLEDWVDTVGDLGDVLLEELEQEVIFYEIQEQGITTEAGEIT